MRERKKDSKRESGIVSRPNSVSVIPMLYVSYGGKKKKGKGGRGGAKKKTADCAACCLPSSFVYNLTAVNREGKRGGKRGKKKTDRTAAVHIVRWSSLSWDMASTPLLAAESSWEKGGEENEREGEKENTQMSTNATRRPMMMLRLALPWPPSVGKKKKKEGRGRRKVKTQFTQRSRR